MEIAVAALEAVEIGHDEGAGQLAGAVGAEVIENHAVALADGGHGLAVFHDDGGLDELVGLFLGVALLYGLLGVIGIHALAQHHGVIGFLHAIPQVIAVHGPIAALDGGDLAHADFLDFGFQFLHVLDAAGGGHVASIHEAMDIHVLHAALLAHFQQSIQVGIVAMHAAVAQQTHQVNGLAGLLGGIQGMDQGRFLKKLAVLNILGDTGQFLIHDTASAHIQVAHFTIAHLAVRQTHVHAAGAQLGIGVLGLQRVQMRRALLIDRIALMSRIDAEAIHNDQSRHGLIHKIIPFQQGFALHPFASIAGRRDQHSPHEQVFTLHPLASIAGRRDEHSPHEQGFTLHPLADGVGRRDQFSPHGRDYALYRFTGGIDCSIQPPLAAFLIA